MTDVEAEIEIAKIMFSGDIEIIENVLGYCVNVSTSHFQVAITLNVKSSRAVYPADSHPSISVEEGCNAGLVRQLEVELRSKVGQLPLGIPILGETIALVRETAAQFGEAYEAAKTSSSNQMDHTESAPSQDDDETLRASGIIAGAPIVDRKSKFLAHVSHVQSVAAVHTVVDSLRAQTRIAVAAHPTIYAYRFRDSNGLLHYDCDDDGETGASKKVLFLMEQLHVEGCVVVVTRWFGGILLGADRFKHIAAVARSALIAGGFVQK